MVSFSLELFEHTEWRSGKDRLKIGAEQEERRKRKRKS